MREPNRLTKIFYTFAIGILVVGAFICAGIAYSDNGDNEIPSGPPLNNYHKENNGAN